MTERVENHADKNMSWVYEGDYTIIAKTMVLGSLYLLTAQGTSNRPHNHTRVSRFLQ